MSFYGMNANAISTRGMSCGATSLSVCGMLCYTIVIEEAPTGGGRPTVGPPNLPKYRPPATWFPWKKPPKLITVSVYAMGQVFTETVMVDNDVEITVDNVSVTMAEDGLTIEIIDVEIY